MENNDEPIESVLNRNNFFHEIIKVAQLAIWEYDLETEETTWSGNTDNFFDPTIIDSLTIQKVYALLLDEDRKKAKLALEKAIRGRVKWDLDLKLTRNSELNQEFMWVRFVGYPVSKGSEVVKLRGLLMDIDESKTAAVELEEKHKEILKCQSLLLNTQINPHFIFNALNSIQYYILQNETAAAIDFIANFSLLMRGVLNNSMQQRISISDEIEWMQRYLQLEQTRHLNKFNFSITVEDEINTNEVTIPTMILQPYVENAIVHGVASMPGKGQIDINFCQTKSKIVCTVEDNGVGRKKSKTINETARHKQKSYGMQITQKKLDVLNQIEEGDFSVEVFDKKNTNGNATGTKVVISFTV